MLIDNFGKFHGFFFINLLKIKKKNVDRFQILIDSVSKFINRFVIFILILLSNLAISYLTLLQSSLASCSVHYTDRRV